jgi:LmbE family N-acetylglucosaminyl deacetylase
MTTLIIAPHPDDEVLGCGGTIAKLTSRGERVVVAVLTAGVPGLVTPEMLAGVRGECREAMSLLGVQDLFFLDFPAGHLSYRPAHELADRIRALLIEHDVRTVYVPHERDLHDDHAAATRATLVAARPLPPVRVASILAYECLSETEWGSPIGVGAFDPTVYEDITEELPRKLDAMRCYTSQLKAFPHPRSLEGITALARVRGSTVLREACEAFVQLREVRA